MYSLRENVRRTMKVCSCTEGSARTSDDANPQSFIFVKLLPDALNIPACSFVDAVQFLRSIYRNLYHML